MSINQNTQKENKKEIQKTVDIKNSEEYQNLSLLYSKLINIDLRIFRPQDIRVIGTALQHLEMVVDFYEEEL